MTPAALFSKGFMPINGPVIELLLIIAAWAVVSASVGLIFKAVALLDTRNRLYRHAAVEAFSHDG